MKQKTNSVSRYRRQVGSFYCDDCENGMSRLGGRYNLHKCDKCGLEKDNLGFYSG